MAIRIASLFVGLTADDRDYRAKLNSSKARTREWQRAVTAATERAQKAFGALSVGAGIATAALTAAYATSAVEIDTLAKNAAKLGDSTENLTAFGLAAEFSGNGADAATVSLQRMVRRISEAAQGTGEAVKAINELGLDAQELARLRPSEAFEAIQEAMEGIVDQNDKVRLTFKFFDSEGVGLVNTTREVLQQARDDVEALGGAISNIEAKAVEDANDSVTRLGLAYNLTSQRITANFAPALQAITDRLFESAQQSQQFQTTIDDLIKSALGGLSTFTGQLANVLGFLEGREEIAEFGAIGYLLFGRKGALIGALIGSVSDTVAVNVDKLISSLFQLPDGSIFGVVADEQEVLQNRLRELNAELRNIGENTGFLGDSIGGFINGVFYDDADEIQAEIAEIESKLVDLGDTSVQSRGVFGSLSSTLHQLSDATAIASGAYGVFNDELNGTPRNLIIPALTELPSISNVVGADIPSANDDENQLQLVLYQNFQDLRVEAAEDAARQIEAIEQRTFSLYGELQETRVEALENQPDPNSFFAGQIRAAEDFQQTWTDFQQEGAADRFAILSGEISGSLAALSQYSRGFFKINQAAGIANAVINTAQGITEALKLPFPANLAAAAVVAAQGAAQVLTISQARFGQSQTPTVGGAAVNTDVSSEGGSTREIESGEDVDAQPSVQNTYFIVSADEIVDPEKLRERVVTAVADSSQTRELQFNAESGVFSSNSEAA